MEILNKLIQPLLNPDDYPLTLDSCASFAAYISPVLYTEKSGLEYGSTLLLALFSLSCNTCKDPDSLSKDTLWEITTAWQDILISIVPVMGKTDLIDLTKEFAGILKNQLLCTDAEQIHIERIVNVVVNFGRCLQKTVPLLTSEILLVLLNEPLINEWKAKVNCLCIWSEFIDGRFCSPYNEVTRPEMIAEIDVVKFFVMAHVKLKVMAEKLEEEEEEEDDDEDTETHTDASADFIGVFENQADILADLLHTTCLARSCLDNYNVVSDWFSISTAAIVDANIFFNSTMTQFLSNFRILMTY